MAGFHQWSKPYDNHALEVTWRLSYGIGLIPLFGILLYRIFRCVLKIECNMRDAWQWGHRVSCLEDESDGASDQLIVVRSLASAGCVRAPCGRRSVRLWRPWADRCGHPCMRVLRRPEPRSRKRHTAWHTVPMLIRPLSSHPFVQVDRGVQLRKFGLLLKYYWHRNLGTSLSWFVWDFAFYGNKLFQGTFIKVGSGRSGMDNTDVLWEAPLHTL